MLVTLLDDVRLLDIAPPDREAEEHALLPAAEEEEEARERERVRSRRPRQDPRGGLAGGSFAVMRTAEADVARAPQPVDCQAASGRTDRVTRARAGFSLLSLSGVFGWRADS